jgi:hypothetical protein
VVVDAAVDDVNSVVLFCAVTVSAVSREDTIKVEKRMMAVVRLQGVFEGMWIWDIDGSLCLTFGPCRGS